MRVADVQARGAGVVVQHGSDRQPRGGGDGGDGDDVAENLVGALEGMDEAIPDRSSFTRARQRLGAG